MPRFWLCFKLLAELCICSVWFIVFFICIFFKLLHVSPNGSVLVFGTTLLASSPDSHMVYDVDVAIDCRQVGRADGGISNANHLEDKTATVEYKYCVNRCVSI